MIATFLAAALLTPHRATLQWSGYTWYVKSAASEGPGPCRWDASNVWVDDKGFLHMKIAKVDGKWSCAEIWTVRDMPFGTYQCQVDCPIDKLDQNIVASMFSYAGPDGIKEIDIEYAKWGHAREKPAWWTVYPNDSLGEKKSYGFNLALGGTYTTWRYTWEASAVHYGFLEGHQPIDSATKLLEKWNYEPENRHSVPQTGMPLHFNLWLFQGHPPTDGKPVEMIVHSFEYQPPK